MLLHRDRDVLVILGQYSHLVNIYRLLEDTLGPTRNHLEHTSVILEIPQEPLRHLCNLGFT
jgi:hypothetical protein